MAASRECNAERFPPIGRLECEQSLCSSFTHKAKVTFPSSGKFHERIVKDNNIGADSSFQYSKNVCKSYNKTVLQTHFECHKNS